MNRNFKEPPHKLGNYYFSRPEIIIYTFCFFILLGMGILACHYGRAEKDARVNGKRITVKISDVSYGRQSDLYFHYKGSVHGVKYNETDTIIYHQGDTIPLLYSEKYDFFVLDRPSFLNKPNVFQMALLFIGIFLFFLLYNGYKKLQQKEY